MKNIYYFNGNDIVAQKDDVGQIEKTIKTFETTTNTLNGRKELDYVPH